jgi:hypothetical protein
MKPCAFKFNYINNKRKLSTQEIINEIEFEENYAEHLVTQLNKSEENQNGRNQ